ncbi:hypothetical protein MCOR25_003175 [Pyricularia grisea]|nr:hypothetical protein MCOR25_003175 [Pyricularia grisea]
MLPNADIRHQKDRRVNHSDTNRMAIERTMTQRIDLGLHEDMKIVIVAALMKDGDNNRGHPGESPPLMIREEELARPGNTGREGISTQGRIQGESHHLYGRVSRHEGRGHRGREA